MIFIDSNVPMYLVGAAHPNKERALEILAKLIRDEERLITDVEVYQEILHRYTAIKRHEPSTLLSGPWTPLPTKFSVSAWPKSDRRDG